MSQVLGGVFLFALLNFAFASITPSQHITAISCGYVFFMVRGRSYGTTTKGICEIWQVAECIFTCFSCYLQNEIKKDVNNRWGDCQKEILHKVISGVTLSICLLQGHMQMSGDSDSSLVVLWWSDWLGCVWMFIWQIKMSLEGGF